MQRLSNSEIRQLADDLLREAADAIKFPEHVSEVESAHNFTLRLSLESAEITYKPQAEAERIVRRCLERLAGSFDALPLEMVPLLLRSLVGSEIKLLLNNFHLELADLLSDLPVVTESQHALLTGLIVARAEDERKALEPELSRQHLVGQQLRNREQRLRRLVDERRELVAPPLLMISVMYEMLHPIWREVKKRYRRYSRISDSWREHLARDFAANDLPPDLIVRLGERYEGEASVLALEHSARQCGAAPNQFGKRSLQALLSASRAWKANCTPREFDEQASKIMHWEQGPVMHLAVHQKNSAQT